MFSFFNKAYDNFAINLGSLYPLFSERTLNEDYKFYKDVLGKEITINLFDSKDNKALDQAMVESDVVVMGGGPLMHIDPMYMIEYAFKKAKKLKKKTALLGCGVGPIFTKKHKKSLINIIKYSDLIVLRDSISKNNLEQILHEFGRSLARGQIFISFDPAVQCALDFNALTNSNQNNYIAISLRDFPKEYSRKNRSAEINNILLSFVKMLCDTFTYREIRLIPMHYFHIGGDDREFLNSIKLDLECGNLFVQNRPLSLQETMQVYQNAWFNVGMRFHAVVLQTIVSGKNYILDYTEPGKGKISGFLKNIDKNRFYKSRYISLQKTNKISSELIQQDEIVNQFIFDKHTVNKSLGVYVDVLRMSV